MIEYTEGYKDPSAPTHSRKQSTKPSYTKRGRWSNQEKHTLLELCNKYEGRHDKYVVIAQDMGGLHTPNAVKSMHSRILHGHSTISPLVEDTPKKEYPEHMSVIYEDLEQIKQGYIEESEG